MILYAQPWGTLKTHRQGKGVSKHNWRVAERRKVQSALLQASVPKERDSTAEVMHTGGEAERANQALRDAF